MQEEIVHSKSWFHRWESNNFPARLLSKGHYQTSTCECIKQFKFVHASDLSSTTDIKFRIIINDPIAMWYLQGHPCCHAKTCSYHPPYILHVCNIWQIIWNQRYKFQAHPTVCRKTRNWDLRVRPVIWIKDYTLQTWIVQYNQPFPFNIWRDKIEKTMEGLGKQ